MYVQFFNTHPKFGMVVIQLIQLGLNKFNWTQLE